MSRTSSRTKSAVSKARPGKNIRKFGWSKQTGMCDFRRACIDAVQKGYPALTDPPQENPVKETSFPETIEYDMFYEFNPVSEPENSDAKIVENHWRWERGMFIVLLLGMIVSICGWVGAYVVFRKALWSSTQEKLELQEKLRQYEPRQPQS